MKYRPIPAVADVRDLPEHINLLRNLQDLHQRLVRLPNTFPVTELGDIVPNYEGQLVDFLRRGRKILADNNINADLWNQEIKVNLSVQAMVPHQLIARKDALVEKLDQMIERWQFLVDKIENPHGPELKCCHCGKKLSDKWVLSSWGGFCSHECAWKGPKK